MAEYHVRCGIAAIYAGTMKSKDEWRNKSEVTNEAIMAVAQFMHGMMPKDEKKFGYTYLLRNGKHLFLTVEEVDYDPIHPFPADVPKEVSE